MPDLAARLAPARPGRVALGRDAVEAGRVLRRVDADDRVGGAHQRAVQPVLARQVVRLGRAEDGALVAAADREPGDVRAVRGRRRPSAPPPAARATGGASITTLCTGADARACARRAAARGAAGADRSPGETRPARRRAAGRRRSAPGRRRRARSRRRPPRSPPARRVVGEVPRVERDRGHRAPAAPARTPPRSSATSSRQRRDLHRLVVVDRGLAGPVAEHQRVGRAPCSSPSVTPE